MTTYGRNTTSGFAATNRKLHVRAHCSFEKTKSHRIHNQGLAILGDSLGAGIDIVIAVTLVTLLHRRGKGVVKMKGSATLSTLFLIALS